MKKINKVKILARGESKKNAEILLKKGILPLEIIENTSEISKNEKNSNKLFRLYKIKETKFEDIKICLMSLDLDSLFKNYEKSYAEFAITEYIKANGLEYEIIQTKIDFEHNSFIVTIKDSENRIETIDLQEIKSLVEGIIIQQLQAQYPKYITK